MSHPQNLFFEPAPPLPPGIAFPKLIMVVQSVPGLGLGGLFTLFGLITLAGQGDFDLWYLVTGLAVMALGGAAFSLAVRLQPGLYRPWKAALFLQGGVGTFFLLLAGSLAFAAGSHDAVFAYPALVGAAICWGTFALLMLPSSRPSVPARPKDAA